MGLTQDEKELYSLLFRSLDPERSGIVTGEKARLTFEKSGLPPNILGEIWQLADSTNMGFLSQFGFCFAMRLIGYTQSGQYPTAQLAETPGPLPKFSGLAPPGQLVPQGTSSSFLQSQPSSTVPQSTPAQQAPRQEPISPVSPADYERFSQMFVRTTGSKSTPLDGNAAKDILTKAKLPTVTLGQIWSLVDIQNKGQLDLPAFVMAMHLIHGLLSGALKQLPPFLPDHLWKSVNPPEQQATPATPSYVPQPAPVKTEVPENQEWSVTPLQKQQFDSIFDSLDTAKTGSLGPDQVASFLKTSRLDQQDLATIWDLSDVNNTGTFEKIEFSIALFLVNRKRAGMPLPNVVPHSLISSLQERATPKDIQTAPSASVSSPAASAAPIAPAPDKKSSAIDDLADVFGSLTPAAPVQSPLIQKRASLQQRVSSSDLHYSKEPPKMKSQLTSSFAPTSDFGKSLMALQPSVTSPSLIGEDVSPPLPNQVNSDTQVAKTTVDASILQTASPATQKPPSLTSWGSQVDYEALRNVPAPPRSRASMIQAPLQTSPATGYFPQADLPRSFSQQDNNDLLADTEIAGKLSDANTDIANISNQVKSLTTQTSNLHEKKVRAEQELARILNLKEDIDAKLKLLRTSYANEVKQVEQVESTLSTAKEETEALRSEASIAEAKLNHLSGELHEKQLAVEEHQKINSVLREKLGNVNAEIAELSKQLESKASESVRLENEANVRKSQHQVALVKIEELKQQLIEVDEKNGQLSKQIEHAQHEEAKAIKDAEEAQAAVKAAELKSASLKAEAEKLKSKKSSSAGIAGIAGAAGVAILGAAGAVGLAASHKTDEKLEESKQVSNATSADTPAENLQDVRKEAQIVPGSYVEETVSEQNAEPEEVTESDVVEPSNNSDEPTLQQGVPPVSSLVDEVVEHPAQDMTGLDNLEEVRRKSIDFEPPTEYEQEDLENQNEKFVGMTNDFDNFGSVVQASTNSYKPTEGGDTVETPVTSPNVSEYRFQPSNVVGGMVGMPGVLVGVQRTDSLTSSIQNNPSMSVRDDNIDEVSDRDALDEVVLPQDQPEVKAGTEGDRSSLGVGLFELVNSEDAKDHLSDTPVHPLSQSFKLPHGLGQQEEEFPPIRELDLDESSSDDEQSLSEKFDDAVAEVGQYKASSQEFDGDFDDLRPAIAEPVTKTNGGDDIFGDEFDDLEVAEDDIEDDIDPVDISITDHFTDVDPSGAQNQIDFSSVSQNPQPVDNKNDEWEQLFAGFGNAAPLPETSNSPPTSANHDVAIAELMGMGFDRKDVETALEKEQWDVEAATNYLLDHA